MGIVESIVNLVEYKQKYRLLIIAPKGIHLKNFLRRIESETSAIHVITTEAGASKFSETVLGFSFKDPFNFFKTPRSILKIHDEFKPDVVHTHQLNSISMYVLMALRKRSTPVVGTAWGSDVLLAVKLGGIRKQILNFILQRATAFTCDSREVEQVMKTQSNKDLDVLLCNYGAESPVCTLPKERIIYSNRLHDPLYRIDKIVRKYAEFKNSAAGNDWKLILAGSGTESEKLKMLVNELNISDSVDFQGWVEKEQNEENYARSSVWVSIPESDATPISLLEAMYHGCFPIVVDLPSIREWIVDGKNGKLISNMEEEFFSNELNEMDEETVKYNRKLVHEKGSATRATENYSNLHRRLINFKRF